MITQRDRIRDTAALIDTYQTLDYDNTDARIVVSTMALDGKPVRHSNVKDAWIALLTVSGLTIEKCSLTDYKIALNYLRDINNRFE